MKSITLKRVFALTLAAYLTYLGVSHLSDRRQSKAGFCLPENRVLDTRELREELEDYALMRAQLRSDRYARDGFEFLPLKGLTTTAQLLERVPDCCSLEIAEFTDEHVRSFRLNGWYYRALGTIRLPVRPGESIADTEVAIDNCGDVYNDF